MIPIKIQCGCGQKYAFDVEPAGGRMSYAVQCPVCSADGTAAANQVIARHVPPQSSPKQGLRVGGHAPLSPTPPLPRQDRALPVQPAWSSVPKARARWLAPTLWAALVTLPLLAGAVWLSRDHGQKREAGSIAAEPQDGLPHTLPELNAWYVEPPAGQNAASFFSQGFSALQLGSAGSSTLPIVGQGKLPSLGTPLPSAMKTALAALLRSNKDALAFFTEGAKFEQSRYPIDLTRGIGIALPHLGKIRDATRLAELAAILHAEDKDGRQAANDVRLALALGRSLETEPELFSQFVRASIMAIAVNALERTVNRTSLNEESLGALSSDLRKMESFDARGEPFNRAVAAEKTISLTLLATPQKLLGEVAALTVDIPAEQRDQVIAYLNKARDLDAEQKSFRSALQELMAARQDPFPVRLKADAMARQRVKDAAENKLVIMGIFLPGLAGLTTKEAGCVASLRLGLTAVALERFRGTHDNKYPAALSELTPEYLSGTPADPFDGQPLRYHKKDAGYTMYSIGPNLKDDSGARMDGPEGDIVFSVVTPPKPAK